MSKLSKIKYKSLSDISPIDMELFGFIRLPDIKEHFYSYTVSNDDGIVLLHIEYALGEEYLHIYNSQHELLYRSKSFLIVDEIISTFSRLLKL